MCVCLVMESWGWVTQHHCYPGQIYDIHTQALDFFILGDWRSRKMYLSYVVRFSSLCFCSRVACALYYVILYYLYGILFDVEAKNHPTRSGSFNARLAVDYPAYSMVICQVIDKLKLVSILPVSNQTQRLNSAVILHLFYYRMYFN